MGRRGLEQRPVNLHNGYYNHPTSCFLALRASSSFDSMLSSAWAAMGCLQSFHLSIGAPVLPVAYALGRLNVWEGAKDSTKEAYMPDGPSMVETTGGEGILLGRLDAHDSILFDTTVSQLSLNCPSNHERRKALQRQTRNTSPFHLHTNLQHTRQEALGYISVWGLTGCRIPIDSGLILPFADSFLVCGREQLPL
jgi:hypothetical protein